MYKEYKIQALKKISLLVPVCLFLSGANLGMALELKEGKWGVTTEVTTPMSATPIVEYTEDCIEGEFDPLAELFEQAVDGCEILSSNDSASRLEMTMQCAVPDAGTLSGKILFMVDGESASGQMDMEMSMAGMTMNMASSWKGEYLGSCHD